MHFRFKPRRNPGSQSQHRSVNRTAVIARNSSFSYRGKNTDVRTIGRELGVRYLLEGSVQRADKEVRINAQLIDTQTGGHLWAERYEGDISDVFDLQDQVIEQVVAALKVTLGQSERDQVARKPTDNPEAYDLYLRAREAAYTYDHKRYKEALSLFEQAITLDPTFAEAYASLSFAAYLVWISGWVWVAPDGLQRAQEAAARAIALDPNSAWANATLAFIEMRHRRHNKAIALAQKLSALAPSDGDLHIQRALILAWSGEPQMAAEALEAAAEVEPRPIARQMFDTALVLETLRHHDKAVKVLLEARNKGSGLDRGLVARVLARNYGHLGELEKAKHELKSGMKHWPAYNYTIQRHSRGFLRRQSDIDHLVEGVKKASVPEWPYGFTGEGYEQLTGQEIKKEVWDGNWVGTQSFTGDKLTFTQVVGPNGDWTWKSSLGGSASGTSRIAGNRMYLSTRSWFQGREYFFRVFRNPGGSAENKDEYITVHTFDVMKFTVQR